MSPDSQEVKACIVAALRQPLTAVGADPHALPDDFDFRARGVIDSLGFVQLIGDLEARFACSINLMDLDPEQLTMLGALSRHIAVQVAFHRAS